MSFSSFSRVDLWIHSYGWSLSLKVPISVSTYEVLPSSLSFLRLINVMLLDVNVSISFRSWNINKNTKPNQLITVQISTETASTITKPVRRLLSIVPLSSFVETSQSIQKRLHHCCRFPRTRWQISTSLRRMFSPLTTRYHCKLPFIFVFCSGLWARISCKWSCTQSPSKCDKELALEKKNTFLF